jgi:hypothetical protein
MDAQQLGLALIGVAVGIFLVRLAVRDRPEYKSLAQVAALALVGMLVVLVLWTGATALGGIPD